MNVRSIIFVVGMTITLFFVNHYFTPQRAPSYALKEADRETQNFSKDQQTPPHRVAHLEELPLKGLYKDLQGRTLLSHSVIAAEGSYLTVKWSDIMPKQIYVQKGSRFLPVYLVGEGDRVGTPALYSLAHKPEIISIHLPATPKDIQCVSFDKGAASVVLGVYDNDTLSFPEALPKGSAIALYETENGYLPVGVYETAQKSFQFLSTFQSLENLTTYPSKKISTEPSVREDFYVLENRSMQIVFSNRGGAIAEINLPFKSASNESVVLPIDFDRIIDKKYPSNALFPMHPFYLAKEGKKVLQKPSSGGYYPLLRRGIAKQQNTAPSAVSPQYYAFNVISNDTKTSEGVYEVTRFDDRSIEFTSTFENRRITKTYAFPEEGSAAPYSLFATVQVDGNTEGLSVTSGVPEVELLLGSYDPTIKYKTVQNYKESVEKLPLPKNATTISFAQLDWISNSNGYFSIIMDPLSEVAPGFSASRVPGEMDPTRITMIDPEYNLYPAKNYPGYITSMPLASNSQPTHFRLFMGPLESRVLKQVDNTFTNQVTGYNPDYFKTRSFHGWFSFITGPLAKFLFFILNFCYKLTQSWGFSIILLTIVVRLIIYPFAAWSANSRVKMQALAPEAQKIKEKYKKDPRRQQIEVMQLYKKHKVNPFGTALPLIIQLPFFFAVSNLLKSTFSLRGVPFVPGWIDNLTTPDVLFTWDYPLPLVGTSFHLLPILLGLITFLQQRLMMAKNKQSMTIEQQKKQQGLGLLMTCVFTMFFYKMASGFNIYFIFSMLLQTLQEWRASKKVGCKKRSKNLREIIIKPKKSK